MSPKSAAGLGGFTKAVIKVLDSTQSKIEDSIEVCFNPKEYQLQRQVQYVAADANQDNKKQQHTTSIPMTLSLTLYFDTFEERTSVRDKYTKRIENLTLLREQSGQQKQEPPLIIFCWGKNIFQGVIESLTQKYTMFLENGTPVRCECTISILHADSN